MTTDSSAKQSPLTFFLLVFGLSIPFWVLGAVASDLTKALPINLPISALMLVCPLIAALILTYREQQASGVKQLLGRIFDHQRINRKIWYLPVVFLMPVLMLTSYGVMRLLGIPLPEPQLPVLMIPLFFIIFFITAIGEEVGWSGYAIDPLQNRWGAFRASLIVGSVWGVWHIVPYIQAHNTFWWIVGQGLAAIGLRVLIVWLYNNTGKSLFAAIIFHAMINVSTFLFPNYSSHYDPMIACVLITATAATVVLLWGPTTLARFRYKAG